MQQCHFRGKRGRDEQREGLLAPLRNPVTQVRQAQNHEHPVSDAAAAQEEVERSKELQSASLGGWLAVLFRVIPRQGAKGRVLLGPCRALPPVCRFAVPKARLQQPQQQLSGNQQGVSQYGHPPHFWPRWERALGTFALRSRTLEIQCTSHCWTAEQDDCRLNAVDVSRHSLVAASD
ncbi:hypothetical protein DV515_00013216 [Chloebia gouldiae]|uniref:Uncharacterized protein n=1 Tax=Chloebia gouldiae TaxID=44316 RepID=A0A3L8S213_CHLGU|nr:hypothetical protein DV515_00013216 [Chloebia gouldiae]